MSSELPQAIEHEIPSGARIAIAAARFNAQIADELLSGCLTRLAELKIEGARVVVHRVPGAFELPVAARMLARTGKFSAVICLGAVIRGDTPHFDFVAGECARGIQQVALKEVLPVIFGVLTTDTLEQARARIGGSHGHAGRQAADAAVEMIAFAQNILSEKSKKK